MTASEIRAFFAIFMLAALSCPAMTPQEAREQAKLSGFLWAISAPQTRSWGEVGNSGSMRPCLDAGMVLLLERASSEDLRKHKGAIALYTMSEDGTGALTISHRVHDVSRRGWVYFSGDANRYSDGWIAPHRIRWRVVKILNQNLSSP